MIKLWIGQALLAIFVAILTVAVTANFTGCAALQYVLPILTDIIADAVAAGGALDRASSVVDSALAQPTDAGTRAKAHEVIERARLALQAALAAARGGKAVSDADYDKAFAEFRAAWADLEKLLGPLGLIDDGRPGAGSRSIKVPSCARTRADQRGAP